jgi:hypothetical protein
VRSKCDGSVAAPISCSSEALSTASTLSGFGPLFQAVDPPQATFRETGMPRLVTRSITLQAIRASTYCANRPRARRLRPIKTLYLWKAVSTSARLLAHSAFPDEHPDVPVALSGSIAAVSGALMENESPLPFPQCNTGACAVPAPVELISQLGASVFQMRPSTSRMIKMTTTTPTMPDGP